jgi:hypothetical protein
MGEEEAAVQRPGTKMGGREEEESSPGISRRKPDRLHGRKTDWTTGAVPAGKLALWRTARRESSVGFVILRMGDPGCRTIRINLN